MEAFEAAKRAMETVTPPPGVSKSDWLAEHGRFALIAGAIAASAPYIQAQEAEDIRDGVKECAPDDYYAIGFVEGYADAARDAAERSAG